MRLLPRRRPGQRGTAPRLGLDLPPRSDWPKDDELLCPACAKKETPLPRRLKRGDQVATVHVNPNGTFEISYISVGPRKDGKQKGITRGVTGR